MFSCNSQVSLQNFEQVDPPHSAILPPRTPHTLIDDEWIKPLPTLGPMSTSVAPVLNRASPLVLDPSATEDVPPIVTIPDNPPSPISLTLTNLLPTIGEDSLQEERQSKVQPSIKAVEEVIQKERQLEVEAT